MKIKLDPGAIMPTRAHALDAGLDLYAREMQVVPAHGAAFFDTGVHMNLPAGTEGDVRSKSGLNRKHKLFCTGTIDEGYTGSIGVTLFNLGDEEYVVRAGDKIGQLVIHPIVRPHMVLVDELDSFERGESGFGSTGR